MPEESVPLGGHAGLVLREPRPADLDHVVRRHGRIYAQEYGLNADFEALVAGIVAAFARDRDPRCERGWIAERHGEVLGAVFVMRRDETTAQLRLLYVEADARGRGLGRALLDEALCFARAAGYRQMQLWTSSRLVDARRLYEHAGFRLIAEEAQHRFGQDQRSQTWSLAL